MKFAPFLLISGCLAAQTPVERTGRLPYDLAAPTKVFELPAALTEVSALTDVDEQTIACVHDEAASVYFISLHDGRVIDSVSFSRPADMEGLTRVGNEFFALRSDGLIFHLGDRASGLAVKDTFRLDAPNKNIEGLGYDERSGLVLVSPKDFVKGSKEGRDERVIYAIDPNAPGHPTSVVLRLSVEDLVGQAAHMGIATPQRRKENGEEVSALKLRYSSVAVHPVTDHCYLLSAADRTLLVVDREGRLIDLVQLDGDLLPKPEGITFMPNGDMWLSSEGKGRTPVLVRYALKE
ncbi:MAG: SdiA-regulated domain-containing protein [Flavobacteriales bacterium]|nr:SdiA-regulated domain-containing protein [Flavobacteriales bacterium]